MSSTPRLLLLALLLFFGFCAVFLTASATPESYAARYADHPSPVTEMLRDLPEIVRTHSLPFSVATVAAAMEKGVIENNGCHTLLHLIGHEAYQMLGDDFPAIFAANKGRLCLGGYLHGVEAQIAQDHPDEPQRLFTFCEEVRARGVANGPCFHGVGHSAFEYSKDAKSSLERCDKLSGGPEPDLWNCYRGVFSELGNALLGIDTNTGEEVQPLKSPAVSVDAPYVFCGTLEDRHQDSCYSQLAKIFYQRVDLPGSFERCRAASDTPHIGEICVSIIAGISARSAFEDGTIPALAAAVSSLEGGFLEAAFEGIREGYIAFAENHPDGAPFAEFCGLLSGEAATRCPHASPVDAR